MHITFLYQDYFSVPQIGEYLQGDTSDLIKAVNSIPSYIERSSHFFACVPTIIHNDRKGVMCDFGSWLSRGWCRLEMFSLLFKRFNELPVIVVKGGECEPYMISAVKTMARPPGSGEFTCCTRDHKMKNPDGTERGISCDKVKIGQLVWMMLQSKLSFMLGDDQLAEYRMWLSLVPRLMQGLPNNDAALKASRSSRPDASEVEDVVKDFLSTYHFKTAKDEEGRGESGLSPLRHAVMVGNVEVAAELIKQGANAQFKLRKFNTTIGADAGMTLLHFATAMCPARHLEMITVLLRAGADANAPSRSGSTPLMGGVMYHNVAGVEALLEGAKDTIDLDRGFGINNATALGFAAYGGTPELCELLIKTGANRTQINDHGGTKLHDACQNVATTKPMLDFLWNDGELDTNGVMRPKTLFWSLLDSYFQMGVKRGLVTKSLFALDLAHDGGSTPLHHAAKHGLIDVTEWLLDHGAHKSLRVRNKMGATPLDIARIFGPFPVIEAKLGAAMLNHQFGAQFAIRRGSLLRKQAGGAYIDPEVVDSNDDSPSDEKHSAEPQPMETVLDSKRVSSGFEGNAVEAMVDTHYATQPTPVETIAGSERVSSGIDVTPEGTAVNVHAACPATNQMAPVNVGAALAMLSSGVEARFNKQAASLAMRFDEQAARSDEQAARLDALQSSNAAVMAKLDVLLEAQQQR